MSELGRRWLISDQGVDDRRQTLDTRSLDRNDEGRLRSIRLGQVEVGVVRRDEETDDDDTADVEEQDTDVDALDRLRQVATRVLRLTGRNLNSRVSFHRGSYTEKNSANVQRRSRFR